MRGKFITYIYILLLPLLFAACVKDIVMADPHQNEFDESDLLEAEIGIRVSGLGVDTPMTRAENPEDITEDATQEEKRVDNLWLFQFDESTGLPLIRPRYYTIGNQSQLSNLRVLLKEGISSTICVVTNTGRKDWIQYGDFSTLDKLKEQTIPNPEPQSVGNLSIPMWGEKHNVEVSLQNAETIEVARMFARLQISIDFTTLTTLTLNSIEINNISASCRTSTRYVAPESPEDLAPAAVYPSSNNLWVTRSITAAKLQAEGGDYVIYVPENIQGEVAYETGEGIIANKATNAPGRALKVNFHVTYTEPETEAESEYTYTVYPGGNYYNNYNIRRNCTYKIEVGVQHDDNAKHNPSSNCLVTSPNKTISFEPYYRVETGGGYNFRDYLDSTVVDKTIARVGIIWQTTSRVDTTDMPNSTVIGNNSAGDKVWYNARNHKIYVKTRGQGNALIAAYNSSGHIIWSWHIWSTKFDPKNVGNAVTYTTYEWDSEGIHSDRHRVPGYSVMKCNLGALAEDPTEDSHEWFQTWGMYYQWGRKDPFPPVKTGTDILDWNSNNLPTPDGRAPGRTHSYDDKYVVALYDNSNDRIRDITEKVDEDKLFHSYTVWGSSGLSTALEGVQYSIANPTVFMAGDEHPGIEIGAPYYPESCDVETGDWLPVPDNRLWGGLDPSEATMSYPIVNVYKGTVYNYNTIYNNYGEKSIFDPCPSGWRVPPDNLWMSFTKTGLNPQMLYSPSNGGSVYPNVAKDVNFDPTRNVAYYENNQGPGLWMYMQEWQQGPSIFFPVQGARRPRGHVTRVLMCGSYLSATVGQPIGDPNIKGGNWINSLHMHYPRITWYDNLYFMVYEYANSIYRSKSTAGAVRCVRDTY